MYDPEPKRLTMERKPRVGTVRYLLDFKILGKASYIMKYAKKLEIISLRTTRTSFDMWYRTQRFQISQSAARASVNGSRWSS